MKCAIFMPQSLHWLFLSLFLLIVENNTPSNLKYRNILIWRWPTSVNCERLMTETPIGMNIAPRRIDDRSMTWKNLMM